MDGTRLAFLIGAPQTSNIVDDLRAVLQESAFECIAITSVSVLLQMASIHDPGLLKLAFFFNDEIDDEFFKDLATLPDDMRIAVVFAEAEAAALTKLLDSGAEIMHVSTRRPEMRARMITRKVNCNPDDNDKMQILLDIIPETFLNFYQTSKRMRSSSASMDTIHETAESNVQNQISPHTLFHPNVSVLFCDIVGYTMIAKRTSSLRLIRMLDELFTEFDILCSRHGVYKVETIGDAYMVVAGHSEGKVIDGDSDNNMAFDFHERTVASNQILAMAHDMLECPALTKFGIHLRIGVHSGPCRSCVMGTQRPRYCFVGDTINTASRMESHGKPMCVHASDAFLRNTGFPERFEALGVRTIKGKGKMPTFIYMCTPK
jgi:class 3 adenylate cyclase